MFNRKKHFLEEYCDSLLDMVSKKDLKKAKKEFKKNKDKKELKLVKRALKRRKKEEKSNRKTGCLLFLFLILFTSGKKNK